MSHLVLEFVGLPGSGKSTVVAEVSRFLEGRGLAVSCNRPIHPQGASLPTGRAYLGFAVAHLAFVSASCADILHTRQQSTRDLFWTTRTWLKRAARLSRAVEGPGLSLLDPGIIQALWSIGLRAEAESFPRLASRLLERAPLPDLAAVVDASDDAIISRLQARPGATSRLEHHELSRETLLPARRRLDQVLQAVEGLGETRPGLLHTANDAGRPPSACAREIADWVAASRDLSAFEAHN